MSVLSSRLCVRALRGALLVILVPLGLYLALAAVLSRLPVNTNWVEPQNGIQVYVITNGVHTGIVVPAVAPGVDWRTRVAANDLPNPHNAGKWLIFGWGDREFYLHTARWSDFRVSTGINAFAGLGTTLMHVDHIQSIGESRDVRPLRLTTDQYRRLAAFIAASFSTRREVLHGYGPSDVFYGANGHYSALRTCNVWTEGALSAAGVKVGVWSPFEDGVMRWVR